MHSCLTAGKPSIRDLQGRHISTTSSRGPARGLYRQAALEATAQLSTTLILAPRLSLQQLFRPRGSFIPMNPSISVSGSDIVHVATRLTQSAAAAPASLRKSSRSILGRLAADSTTEAAQTPRQTDTISGNVSPEPQQVHRSRSMELVHSLSKEATAAGSPMEAAGGDIRGRQQAERAVMERVSMLHKEVSEFKQKLKQREEAEDPIRKGALRVYAFVRVWGKRMGKSEMCDCLTPPLDKTLFPFSSQILSRCRSPLTSLSRSPMMPLQHAFSASEPR